MGSEDVNQDGFVDPIGAAVAPVAVAAPVAAALPAVHYGAYALPAVKPVEVKVEKVEPVEVKAPVVTYAAASSRPSSTLCRSLCCSSPCSHCRSPTSCNSYLHRPSFNPHRNCPCRYPHLHQHPPTCFGSWSTNPWTSSSCCCRR